MGKVAFDNCIKLYKQKFKLKQKINKVETIHVEVLFQRYSPSPTMGHGDQTMTVSYKIIMVYFLQANIFQDIQQENNF